MSIRRSAAVLVLLLTILAPALGQTQNDRAFAVSLYNRGMFEEAAELLAGVVEKGQAEAFDQALLGLCHLRLDNLSAAETLLEQARRRNPHLSIVHLGLGQLRFQQQQFPEAYRAFSRAEELDPESRDAREGRVASLINRGAELYADGKPDDAEVSFRQALQLDGQSVPALRNLGILELDRGNVEKAAFHVEKARDLSPNDTAAQILLVRIRERQGNQDALLRELQRLVQVQPRNPDAWAKLGMLYEQYGDAAQAETSFEQAERLGSGEPYPYYWLARKRGSAHLAHLAAGKAVQKAGLMRLQAAARIERREGDLGEEDLAQLKQLSERIEEPLVVLEDTLKLLAELRGDDVRAFGEDLILLCEWYPHSTELKEALAAFHQDRGDWSRALAVWEEVLSRHPSSAEAQGGRARALDRLGRAQEALLAFRRALDLDPRNEARYRDLMDLYRRLEREHELLTYLREQALRDPRNPVLFGHLAELEERLGFPEQAAAHRRRQKELEAALR